MICEKISDARDVLLRMGLLVNSFLCPILVIFHPNEDEKSWEDAQLACSKQGWNLAAPRSAEETRTLWDAVATISDFGSDPSTGLFWIGFKLTNDIWESFDIGLIFYAFGI